jgi:hypothetical protein
VRIVLLAGLIAGCRSQPERIAPPPTSASPDATAPVAPAKLDPRHQLAALCEAATAKRPGWMTPIPSTPDGPWPPLPEMALAKRRLSGRCDDASLEAHAALRALVLPKPEPGSRPPNNFDVCVQDKRFLIATQYLVPGDPPGDYADLWPGDARLTAVPMVDGMPHGKPVLLSEEMGPFADFDGDGVPELVTWSARNDQLAPTTYTITVWFAHGKKPVVWSHTVATLPSRLTFVTASGRPALLFGPTGLADDWFAPSDLEVFAVAPDGVKPLPDAARELWQLGEPDRRLRWGQSACVDLDDAADSPDTTAGVTAGASAGATAGASVTWWEHHLLALGASPDRARDLAPALVTPPGLPPPSEPPDAFELLVRAIRSKRAETCTRPDAAHREAFEHDHTRALEALTEERGTELSNTPDYAWGCTTHGETLVTVEYGPSNDFAAAGVRGVELWSVPSAGPPIRRMSAIDPRSHHEGPTPRVPIYILRLAGYGDFDGDGTLEALVQFGWELPRSNRYFDGYLIWDGAKGTELALPSVPDRSYVYTPMLVVILDGAKPTSPSLLTRLDAFVDECNTEPSRCAFSSHPPPIMRFTDGKLTPASKAEVAAVVARVAPAVADYAKHP